MTVRSSARNNSSPTGRIFMKFGIWVFFEKLSRNFKCLWTRTTIKGILHDDQHTFSIISRSFLLKIKKSHVEVVENLETHFFHSITVFENHAVYEIMWENVVESCRPQMAIRRMRLACWLPKTTKHTQVFTQYFSNATMVVRTRLSVTLYVHRLSC
jgi:hypothetical protein